MKSTHAGRNDPCPCGSGQKYKHCCLSKAIGTPRDDVTAELAAHRVSSAPRRFVPRRRTAVFPPDGTRLPAGAVGSRPIRIHELGRYAITWLYNASPEAVAHYDLAEMNLISARGLPGAKDLDIGAMLALLDSWAKQVAAFTLKHISVYHARPAEFGSLARFRVTAMLHCLNREIGIRYNPDRKTDPHNFDDPEDSFIHGLLGPRRLGTCASLPVLLTALGRRLGYPLKLVTAPQHLFCRWDSPEERFNIEYNEEGFNSQPDEHYQQWPVKWVPELHEQQRRDPIFLLSLTPQQELSYCAQQRAVHLDSAGRREEALAAMHVAYQFWPNPMVRTWLTHLTTKVNYPDKNWPDDPCEETAGDAAIERLVREKGAILV